MELVGYYSAPPRRAHAVDPDAGLRAAARAAARLHGPGLPRAARRASRCCPAARPTARACPPPAGPRHLATRGDHVAPATGTERALADALAAVLGRGPGLGRRPFLQRPRRQLAAHGACSAPRVRERGDLPPVSMRDIYLNPTVRLLAAAIGEPGRATAARRRRRAARGAADAAAPPCRARPAAARRAAAARTRCAARCSCWSFAGLSSAACRWRWTPGAGWAAAGHGALGTSTSGWWCSAGRAAGRLAACRSLAKWLLIGRWKPRRIRAWSLAYFRFWLVKTMIVANPLACCCRHPAVRVVPAGAGRQGRPPRGDLHPARAGLHRPADDRRGHRDPQGQLLHRLPRPGRRHRDRPGHRSARASSSASTRSSTSTPPWATARSSGMPPRCSPARRCPAGRVLARLARPSPPGRATTTARSAPARCGALRRAGYSLTRLAARAGRGRPRRGRRHQPAGVPPPAAGRCAQPGGRGRLAGTLGRAGTAAWMLPVGVLVVAAAVFSASSSPGWSSPAPCPACSAPLLTAGTGVPALRVPLHGASAPSPGCRTRRSSTPCSGTARLIVRYLGLIGYRLAPVEQTGSNFGMEVKHEMPTLSRRGHRHDGLRRPVDDQRRVLQQLVPGRARPSSGPATSWATGSPTPRAAGPATTACSPPRS